MRKLLLISFCFFSCFFIAQNNSLVLTKKKQHFQIHSKNNMLIPEEIENSIANAQLDSLRYIDQKRWIPIEGGQYTLELFSANELLTQYARQIHPLNRYSSSDQRKFIIQYAKGNIRIVLQ